MLALAALRRRGAALLATAGSAAHLQQTPEEQGNWSGFGSEARKQCFLRVRRGVSRVTSSRSGDARLGSTQQVEGPKGPCEPLGPLCSCFSYFCI